MREILEKAYCDGGYAPTIDTHREEQRPWEMARDFGYLTYNGVLTVDGFEKLTELRSPVRYWLKTNAIAIATLAATVVIAIATTLALVRQ